MQILTAILATFYIYIGVYASGAASYAGIGGGVVVLAGLLIRKRLLFLAIIIGGAVPLAVLTWWSIVTPIIAFALIAFGATMTRQMKV